MLTLLLQIAWEWESGHFPLICLSNAPLTQLLHVLVMPAGHTGCREALTGSEGLSMGVGSEKLGRASPSKDFPPPLPSLPNLLSVSRF